VATVRRIKYLIGLGLPLERARSLLPCVVDPGTAAAAGPEPCPELVSVLRRELERLDEAAAEVARTRRAITRLLAGDPSVRGTADVGA
jgi:DNA-binding transcriptional MerR regulator